MSNDNLKSQICDALAAWIRQRPGLEFGNYGDVTSYRAEARGIVRDKRDAETLLAAVRWRDSITGEALIEAAKRAYSGRLEIKVSPAEELPEVHGYRVKIEYTAGQYWCVEFRRAAAAVLASALWEHMRENMPAATAHRVEAWGGIDKERSGRLGIHAACELLVKKGGQKYGHIADLYDTPDKKNLSAGDWLRNRFRKEFGSKLQRRWFN